ncbi:hypothetical protein QTN25_008867 [Entamoeba marina]
MLTFLNLFFLSYSQCTANLRVEPFNLLGVTSSSNYSHRVSEFSSIAKYCYSDIDDSTIVFGIAIHAECYVPKSMFYYNTKDLYFPQCGNCISISGPSDESYDCIVAGMYEMEENDYMSDYDVNRTILVADIIFKDLVLNIPYDEIVPVTAVFNFCQFKMIPHLITTSIIDNCATIYAINLNIPTKYLLYSNLENKIITIPMSIDGNFIVCDLNASFFQLVAITNNVVNFAEFNITNIQQPIGSSTPFFLWRRTIIFLSIPPISKYVIK